MFLPGNKSDVKPVPPDVVAQIVAQAQRKIKSGQTPTEFTLPPAVIILTFCFKIIFSVLRNFRMYGRYIF